MFNAIKIKSEDLLLDLGCGPGNYLLNVTCYLSHAVGIDISKHAVIAAKDAAYKIRAYNKISLSIADANKLPFRDETFTKAIAIDFLEHLYSPEVVLKEVHRVLKKGGLFHLFTNNSGICTLHYIEARLRGINSNGLWPLDDPTHIRRFKVGELEEMVRNVGFKIGDRQWFDHLFSWFRGKILENLAIRTHRLLMRSNLKRSKKVSYKKVSPIGKYFSITTTALDELDMKLFGHVPSAGIFMTLRKP
jgi:SAM-dependent methyltransferase